MSTPAPNSTTGATMNAQASLPRRLGAMLYDSLLLLAVLMLGTAAMLFLTGGEAIRSDTHPMLEWAYRVLLVVLTLGFFGLFWTRGGQTLGMAAWRIKVERDDGARLTWRDSAVRLACAVLSWLPAGLGFLWMLFDRDRKTWHDRLSHTRVVLLPKH
jgi:uncharacterized RDD family membrane protein YckC